MRKIIEKYFCNAWEAINEILEERQADEVEKENQLQEAQEALEKVDSWENLEYWFYDYFGKLSNYYYNHLELVKDSDNQIKYMVLIQSETYEFKEFQRIKNTINWAIKPLEFIKEYTNWDNQLIDSVSYAFGYFEEENPNLTQFELENQSEFEEISEYKQSLKDFIINEISDNILND